MPARRYSRRVGNPRAVFPFALIAILTAALFAIADEVACESPAVLRVYLARHGQTDWNAEHRLQGGSDVALNAAGRKQAAQLADRVKGVALDAVYASALRRSRETAEIVHGSVPVQILAGLNERRLGSFEGRRIDAADPANAAAAHDYDRRSQDPKDTLDGGESLSQFFARVQAAVRSITERHGSRAILIIGHGGTNQMIVRALLGLTAEEAHGFVEANDDLYLIDMGQGASPRLWKWVDPHAMH
jgi:probable phosphoglycerate mutase